MLQDGRLHLSGIAKLAPVLTEANSAALLARTTHETMRKIEELVAEVAPSGRTSYDAQNSNKCVFQRGGDFDRSPPHSSF